MYLKYINCWVHTTQISLYCADVSHDQSFSSATPTTEEDTAAPTGCVLSLWSINGTLVNRMKIESEVTCLTYTTAPEGVYINVIATGMRDGNVKYVCVFHL